MEDVVLARHHKMHAVASHILVHVRLHVCWPHIPVVACLHNWPSGGVQQREQLRRARSDRGVAVHPGDGGASRRVEHLVSYKGLTPVGLDLFECVVTADVRAVSIGLAARTVVLEDASEARRVARHTRTGKRAILGLQEAKRPARWPILNGRDLQTKGGCGPDGEVTRRCASATARRMRRRKHRWGGQDASHVRP